MLQGMNKPIIIASYSVVSCLTNIVLNYLIIPSNGLLSNIHIGGYNISISGPAGAALSTVLSVFVIFFGYRIWAKKLTGIKLLQTHTLRHLIAGCIMGISLYILSYQTPLFAVIRWYTLLGFSLAGFGIYILILFLLKEFSKKDLKFFIDTIHPKGIVKYVKSEIKNNKKN